MPLFKRQELPKLLTQTREGVIYPVYLLFGERFLCREAAEALLGRLLPDEKERRLSVKTIDGEQEDPGQTLRLLRTYSLFSGRQIIRVQDSKLFYSREVARTFWEKAKQAHAEKDLERAGRLLLQMVGLAGLGSPEEAAAIGDLPEGRWRALFGFAKPQEAMTWLDETLAAAGSFSQKPCREGTQAADQFLEAFEAGLPPANILILLSEAVDKRKRFYKYVEKHGAVVELTIDSGSSAAARQAQEALLLDLLRKTLAGFQKTLEPRAVKVFLERVGFHPVAVVREAEKLALYADEARVITLAHLNAMVGRTREEALYELTEAVAERQTESSLLVLDRLLDHQLHPLVVIAGLRNHFRKLLQIRALQEQTAPAYGPGMAYPVFQKSYLPQLKATLEEGPAQLSGHPFVVYKQFRQAERFTGPELQEVLAELLQAEFRLKSSGIPDYMVMQNLVFRLCATSAAGWSNARDRNETVL